MNPMIKGAIGLVKGRIGIKVPIKVEHVCTYRCNYRCSYCKIWAEKSSELSTEEVKEMMRQFAKAGAVSWNFTGGEPLLRQDIKNLAFYAKELGMHVTINTNGSLVKDHVEWLKDLDLVGISLDGLKEIQDANRGEGSFERAVDAIESLKEAGAKVYICSVAGSLSLKDNAKGLKDLLAFVLNLGVKIAVLPLFEDSRNIGTVDSVKKEMDGFNEAVKALKQFKKEHPGTLMVSNPTLNYFEKGMPRLYCYAGKHFCTVYPDGAMSPCLFMPKIDAKGDYIGAFKRMNKMGMVDCNKVGFKCQLCYLEYNNIFSMRPGLLVELLRNS